MTQEQIIQNNKLIAEFMGLSTKHNYPIYHMDWNALMAAVKKCLEIYNSMDVDDEENAFYDGDFWIDFTDSLPSLESCYDRVVEYIQAYNNKTTTN